MRISVNNATLYKKNVAQTLLTWPRGRGDLAVPPVWYFSTVPLTGQNDFSLEDTRTSISFGSRKYDSTRGTDFSRRRTGGDGRLWLCTWEQKYEPGMSSLIHVGHWRFACEPQPAVSHVRLAIDTDISPLSSAGLRVHVYNSMDAIPGLTTEQRTPCVDPLNDDVHRFDRGNVRSARCRYQRHTLVRPLITRSPSNSCRHYLIRRAIKNNRTNTLVFNTLLFP